MSSTLEAEVGERMAIKSMDKGKAILDVIKTLVEEWKAKRNYIRTENETVKFNKDGKKCQKADISTKDVCLTNFVQEEEDCNPLMINNDIFSYESLACLKYNEQIRKEIHSINSSDKNIHDEKKPEKTPPRWHCCKPVHAMNEAKEWGTWPTCNPNSSVCSGDEALYKRESKIKLKGWICLKDQERSDIKREGMTFEDFLQVKYGNTNVDATTRERRYYEWVAQNYDFEKIPITKYINPSDPSLKQKQNQTPAGHNTYFFDFPYLPKSQTQKNRQPRDDSFEDWVKFQQEHFCVSNIPKCELWVKNNFNIEINSKNSKDDPYSRSFGSYMTYFDPEIKQLGNEYKLKACRKRYALEKVCKTCEKFYDPDKEWYDEGFEEEELWQNEIEKEDYKLPLVKKKTFEVQQFTFDNKETFTRISKQNEEVLTLGRVNGARFMEKIRKEINNGRKNEET
ncbi:hypothetical protein Tco_1380796 [Tanacetum coccineum]